MRLICGVRRDEILRIFLLLVFVLPFFACSGRTKSNPKSASNFEAFPPDYDPELFEVPFCDLDQRHIGQLIALHGVLINKNNNWLLQAGAECNSNNELVVHVESHKSCAGDDVSEKLSEINNDDNITGNVLVYGTLLRSQSTYAFNVTCFDYVQIIKPCNSGLD